MDIRSFIQRHEILSYFVLAFIVAWGGTFAAVGPKFLRGEALQFTDALFAFIPMLIGPSLAGISMAYIVDGKKGVGELFSRMRLWRVDVHWYSAILIFPVLILAVQIVLVALLSKDFTPYFFPEGILIGLLAGFIEEIGWTGFILPKMNLKHCPLVTGILLGVIHSLWHVAPDYLTTSGARGIYWMPHFAMFLISMTAMRVLLVWVYTNTGSLLLAQLMHSSSTGFLSILVPLSLSPRNDTIFYGLYSVALWTAVIIVAVKYGKNLSSADKAERWRDGVQGRQYKKSKNKS